VGWMSVEPIAAFDFGGFLGRVDITADRAVLRFYPYGSVSDLRAKPVLSVVCIRPQFDRSAIDSYGDTEVQEVILYDSRVEYIVWQADDPNRLSCQSATAEWVQYDTADLMASIAQLAAANKDLSEKLWKATKTNADGLKLALELLSRAEIKATASVGHANRQRAVITVLKRFITHFEQI
jgi:hypothetical protein